MSNLLDNQRVQKRKHSGVQRDPKGNPISSPARKLELQEARPRTAKKTAFRPASVMSRFEENSPFIDRIKQKPARIQRQGPKIARPRKEKRAPRERVPFFSISLPIGPFPALREIASSFFPQSPKKAPKGSSPYGSKVRGTVKKEAFFGSPLMALPMTALFILILGFFFIIRSQGGSLDFLDREVISTEGDNRSYYSLARYAGIESADTAERAESGDLIPLDLAEAFAWHSYRVQRGDSVSRIAANFSVSMDAIIASNGIINARSLREGEVLRIPNMDGIPYTVKAGDNLTGISQTMGVPLEAILDANDIQSDVIHPGVVLFIPGARMGREELRMALGESLFIYPLRGGRLTSPFGWRNDPFTGVRSHHAAIDLAASTGTPVWAAMDGRISARGFDRIYGNFIIMTHSQGFQTMYAHLHTIDVERGTEVRRGAQIGTVGNTGYSTGPHLHFAVYRNGIAVNPLDFLGNQR
ncbi:MAG: M23 family metallopeptidase [Treponema sp.]|nr:M23 family metallopeptidase [Treponema sp.]